MKTDEFPPGSMQWFHPVLKEEVVFVFEGYYVGMLFHLKDCAPYHTYRNNEWVPWRPFTPEEHAGVMAALLSADFIPQNWI